MVQACRHEVPIQLPLIASRARQGCELDVIRTTIPPWRRPQKKEPPEVAPFEVPSAPCRNRTYNLMIKSHLLCQLS